MKKIKEIIQQLIAWLNRKIKSLRGINKNPSNTKKRSSSAKTNAAGAKAQGNTFLQTVSILAPLIITKIITFLKHLALMAIRIIGIIILAFWNFLKSPLSFTKLGLWIAQKYLVALNNVIINILKVLGVSIVTLAVWCMGWLEILLKALGNIGKAIFNSPNVVYEQSTAVVSGFFIACEKAILGFLSFLLNKIVLGVIILSLLCATHIAQKRYTAGIAKQLLVSSRPTFIHKVNKHSFASMVNIGANLEEGYFKSGQAVLNGTVWLNFATGTECLDLLKKFEFQNSTVVLKNQLLTTQTDDGTTACIFSIETNVKPNLLPQYFPFGFLTLDLLLQNKYLFPEECSFVTNDHAALKMSKPALQNLGVFATKHWDGQTKISMGHGKNLRCPAVLFRLFCQKFFWGEFLALLLTLILILMLIIPMLALTTNAAQLLLVTSLILYAALLAIPYYYFGPHELKLWNTLSSWQGGIVLFTQLLANIYITSSSPSPSALRPRAWLVTALLLNLLYWFI